MNKPRFLREYFLWRAGSKVTGSTLHQATIAGMMAVIEGETGSSWSVGNGYSMVRDRDRICFVKNPAVEGFTYPVRIGEEYQIGSFRFRSSRVSGAELNTDPNIEFADEAALGTDLQIRTWQASDWFIPLGMHQKKKLSDFFIDSKIPFTRKHSIPVVVADGAIVWICGLRLDDRVKITDKTKSIIKLEYSPDILP